MKKSGGCRFCPPAGGELTERLGRDCKKKNEKKTEERLPAGREFDYIRMIIILHITSLYLWKLMDIHTPPANCKGRHAACHMGI